LTLLALCPLSLLADSDTTQLRIEVKTHTGRAIERASVVVNFVEGRSITRLGKKARRTWDTKTSLEGVARIPEVPKGKVRIQIIAKGYQTFGQIFELQEDEQTIEIKLNPPQPQYSSQE
jgi:hypothetical protein